MENGWSVSATQTERVDLDAMKIPQQLQRTLKSLYDLCHTGILSEEREIMFVKINHHSLNKFYVSFSLSLLVQRQTMLPLFNARPRLIYNWHYGKYTYF